MKNKMRVIQDYEKLNKEIQEQIKLKYPHGFSQHLIRFTNHKGELISALPFETEDKYYMVRMSVQKAKQLIANDNDYDKHGNLREDIKERYKDEYEELGILDEDEDDF